MLDYVWFIKLICYHKHCSGGCPFIILINRFEIDHKHGSGVFLFIWLFIKFMRYSSYLIYHSNTTMHMFYWQERLLFVKRIPLDPISYMINPLSYKINLYQAISYVTWTLNNQVSFKLCNLSLDEHLKSICVFAKTSRWYWNLILDYLMCLWESHRICGGKDQVDLIK